MGCGEAIRNHREVLSEANNDQNTYWQKAPGTTLHCWAGSACIAAVSAARCSVITGSPKGFRTERNTGQKSSPTTATHGGFWAMFGSHACSSTKKKPWELQQATELFLKRNLSVGRMKPICWERNKYQSKFPLACQLIPNWARGSAHLCWWASCSARDLAGCTLTSSTALWPPGVTSTSHPLTTFPLRNFLSAFFQALWEQRLSHGVTRTRQQWRWPPIHRGSNPHCILVVF